MLFYPIDYEGVGLGQYQGCSYGLLGWQGVVPAKTEKMALRLVDVITNDLLSLREVFESIDPDVLAKKLEEPVLSSIEKDCGWYWSIMIKPFLPFVLKKLTKELQNEIEDVLDLNYVVLNAFVKNKQILVDLFQKVGKCELQFLVESGFGLGFIFGIGQMCLWSLLPKKWTLPLAGALVGYITNWMAIKLLFEPADPIDVGPFVLQGLFESRQNDVSEEFGQFMESRVLTSSQLLDALSNYNQDEFYKFLRKHLPYPIPDKILHATINAIYNIAHEQHRYPEIHSYLSRELDISTTLATRLKLLTPTKFENLLHPVFQEDELILIVVGGILGALAGLVQVRIASFQSKFTSLLMLITSLSSSAFFFHLTHDTNLFPIQKEPIPSTLKRKNTILRKKL